MTSDPAAQITLDKRKVTWQPFAAERMPQAASGTHRLRDESSTSKDEVREVGEYTAQPLHTTLSLHCETRTLSKQQRQSDIPEF